MPGPLAVNSLVEIQTVGGSGGDNGSVIAITGSYLEINSNLDSVFPDKVYPWSQILEVSVVG